MLLTRQEKRSRRRTNAFGYDARSELTSAPLGNAAYAYAFDNVGNRSSATEAGTLVEYVGAFPRGETLHFFFTILRLISGTDPCLMRFAEAEKESRSRG